MTRLQIVDLRQQAGRSIAAAGFASNRELALAKGVTLALSERDWLLKAVQTAERHFAGGGRLVDSEIAEILGETLDIVLPDRD